MDAVNWKLGGIWTLVLILSTALVWQIVDVADSRVRVAPVEVPVATTATTATTTSPTGNAATINGSDVAPTTTAPDPSPITTSPATTTTTSATTSTDVDPVWSVRTINSAGGIVVVRYQPGEVELQAATPAPGFDVEIDEAGPPRVKVEFGNDSSDYDVRVEWKDGELVVETGDD